MRHRRYAGKKDAAKKGSKASTSSEKAPAADAQSGAGGAKGAASKGASASGGKAAGSSSPKSKAGTAPPASPPAAGKSGTAEVLVEASGHAEAVLPAAKDGVDKADRIAQELEDRMHDLAEAGDYVGAAEARDELSSFGLEDENLVLWAHKRLYKAFEEWDLNSLKAVWYDSPTVQCIHLVHQDKGYDDVIARWEQRLKGLSEDATKIAADAESVIVHGGTAIVTCLETVKDKMGRKASILRNYATNVFRKVRGKWLLVHRHVTEIRPGFGAPPMTEDSSVLSGIDDASELEDVVEFTIDGDKDLESSYAQGQVDALMRMRHSIDRHFRDVSVAAEPGYADGHDDDEDPDDDDEDDDELYTPDDAEEDIEAAREANKALRRLVQEGKLSQQQMTLLQSDMIHAQGSSAAQGAFELLLRDASSQNKSEREASWAEFGSLMEYEARQLKAPRREASK